MDFMSQLKYHNQLLNHPVPTVQYQLTNVPSVHSPHSYAPYHAGNWPTPPPTPSSIPAIYCPFNHTSVLTPFSGCLIYILSPGSPLYRPLNRYPISPGCTPSRNQCCKTPAHHFLHISTNSLHNHSLQSPQPLTISLQYLPHCLVLHYSTSTSPPLFTTLRPTNYPAHFVFFCALLPQLITTTLLCHILPSLCFFASSLVSWSCLPSFSPSVSKDTFIYLLSCIYYFGHVHFPFFIIAL